MFYRLKCNNYAIAFLYNELKNVSVVNFSVLRLKSFNGNLIENTKILELYCHYNDFHLSVFTVMNAVNTLNINHNNNSGPFFPNNSRCKNILPFQGLQSFIT